MNSNDDPEAETVAAADGAAGAGGTEGTGGTGAVLGATAVAGARDDGSGGSGDDGSADGGRSDGSEGADLSEAARTDGADPGGTANSTALAPTRRLFWSALGIALGLLLLDQGTKWWAVGALGNSESIPVIGDFIRFWLVYNPGAAFSLGTGVTWIFTVFAGVAVVAIAWYAWRLRSIPWTYALGLLLGGATSHFGDRLFRDPGFGRGHVVDFIDYSGFFVGNVADIGIFAGAVTIVVLSFKGIEATHAAPTGDTTHITDTTDTTRTADAGSDLSRE
ncbi:signal peptidase II [Streptomyces sp. PSRA5]|uniref:signal peptidase II n=1 Tax=Streptomyces panacea TaxID=3035064 RepID=UPI00339C5433